VTGWVDDMRESIGRATVAVCPVVVKVGIQNKILEAMALGLPVVSSREGAEGIEAEEGRDFLVADDPAAFAAEVCRLLDDAELRARIGRAGRRYVETQHRWDVAAAQLVALYQRAIAEKARIPEEARAC
jgi:glycosyltransferase involved in cell wall biosynthesis